MINVRLNDVCVRQRTRRRKRRLNCDTKIDADNLACSPTRRKQRVTPFAATTFEHYFVAKKLRRHGRYPAQKLFRVTLIFLREMLPLPTKPFESREARYAASDRKRSPACRTAQLALHDLFRLQLSDGEFERTFTRWTNEIGK